MLRSKTRYCFEKKPINVAFKITTIFFGLNKTKNVAITQNATFETPKRCVVVSKRNNKRCVQNTNATFFVRVVTIVNYECLVI